LAGAVVTMETERIKGSNPWCLWRWLKSDYYNGYFTCIPTYIYDHISFSSSQNENISESIFREIKTQILYSISFWSKILQFMS
jgi:hypothetical protein